MYAIFTGTAETRSKKKCILFISSLTIILAATLSFSIFFTQTVFASTINGNSSQASKASLSAKSESTKQKVKWVTRSNNIYCKVNGKTQRNGIKAINGKKYLFDKGGKQLTSWHKVGNSYYYFNPVAKAKGSMVKSKVVNGIFIDDRGRAVLNSEAQKELNILTRATALVEEHTRLGWSEKKKLRTIFNLLRDKYNERAIRKFSSKYGWYRAFALDILINKTGSCHSYASAFAYIANAIGVKSCKIVSSGGHSWTELNGRVYDAEWSRHSKIDLFDIPYSRSGKGGVQAYGAARYYIVTVAPNAKIFTPKTNGSTTGKVSGNNLVSRNGKTYFIKNGKLVKSQWVTWKGAKYYFKKSGIAATGPTKIKGAYYIFNAKGKLSTGKKTHIVTYKKHKYRVTKSGKAKPGWDASKTHMYAKTGRMYTATNVIGETFYAFNAKGVYNAERTKQLRSAAIIDKDASALLALLGKPQKSSYQTSCNVLKDGQGKELYGDDGILTYGNFIVYTFKADNGIEYYRGASAR